MSQKSARKARAKQPPPVKSAGAGGGIPRTWLYAGGGALVAVIAIVVIVVSLAGGGEEAPPAAVAGEETEQLLSGIPQDGLSLGNADAPSTMVEFADLQCPFCQQYTLDVQPTVLDEYVRPGDLRLEFSGMAFIGPDSEKALRAVLAASLQDKAWNVADLLYTHQGEENEGWVTDELLRAIGEAVPGLDADQMLDDMDSDAVDQLYAEAQQRSAELGVDRTPTFFLVSGGGEPQKLEVEGLNPDAFRTALDEQLG